MTPRLQENGCVRVATLAVSLILLTTGIRARAAESDPFTFSDRYCSSCHNDVDREGGLDLTSLAFTPDDAANFSTWVKIHDRVRTGEMPPREKKRPVAAEQQAFVAGIAARLTAVDHAVTQRDGRATRRRLNRYEYENALRDLLDAPWLQLKDRLPEDGVANGFNKIGDALDVSHVHMARYMSVADYALREVTKAWLLRPETKTVRYYARDESSLTQFTVGFRLGSGTPDRAWFPLLGNSAQPEVRAGRAPITVGDSDSKTRELEAVGWVSSNYVIGYLTHWRNFTAPVTGRYRMRFSGYTVWAGPGGYKMNFHDATPTNPRGHPEPAWWYVPNFDDLSPGRRSEPVIIYSGGGVARRLGAFDLTPHAAVHDLGNVWLNAGEWTITDATRYIRPRPSPAPNAWMHTSPLAQRDGMPGVAFRWMEVEGPLYDEKTGAGYRLMFGDLPLQRQAVAATAAATDGPARGRGRGRGAAAEVRFDVTSAAPAADAERLIRSFLQRAYRRPVHDSDTQIFLKLFHTHFADMKFSFADSMLATYTAILASPEFVYLDEAPGKLDDCGLATRLAFFLWNSEPDPILRDRARRGELHQPGVLREETERLLQSPKSARFVDAFLDYWLELRKMDETNPDEKLYNDYYLDDSLVDAAQAETRMYFTDLVARNLPARNIIDSDYTFLNERLASHYGLHGVEGVAMRPVALPAGTERGGFLTQASILKVTANGTTTSPVIRGKWVLEHILGFEVPPPPAAVPAVEPDIRGAVTIRQQLDKHRADESCAVCHRKIDPLGLALESFDILGGWRQRYRALSSNRFPEPGWGKNGWPYAFHYALPVEPDGQLADGRAFDDVRDFKALLLADEDIIARNLVQQLVTYATGAPVRFGDRPAVEEILRKTRAHGFGVRSIIHEVIQSETFLNK